MLSKVVKYILYNGFKLTDFKTKLYSVMLECVFRMYEIKTMIQNVSTPSMYKTRTLLGFQMWLDYF